jgi:hypothetical protein
LTTIVNAVGKGAIVRPRHVEQGVDAVAAIQETARVTPNGGVNDAPDDLACIVDAHGFGAAAVPRDAEGGVNATAVNE